MKLHSCTSLLSNSPTAGGATWTVMEQLSCNHVEIYPPLFCSVPSHTHTHPLPSCVLSSAFICSSDSAESPHHNFSFCSQLDGDTSTVCWAWRRCPPHRLPPLACISFSFFYWPSRPEVAEQWSCCGCSLDTNFNKVKQNLDTVGFFLYGEMCSTLECSE